MVNDHHQSGGTAGAAIGLLDAAYRICEGSAAGARIAPTDRVQRIASLLTAFATVYLVDRDGRLIRPLQPDELAGAAMGPDGALVFSDGRPALANIAVLEASLDELRERFARLGILGKPAD